MAGEGKVPLRVIRYHLGNVLEVGSPQGRFLTQGVTFSGLRPMRSVSSRVVCILGLNADAFPRQIVHPVLICLETGERVIVLPGRMIGTCFLKRFGVPRIFFTSVMWANLSGRLKEIPPSVVINELLDALDEIAEWKDSEGNPIPAVDAVVKSRHSILLVQIIIGATDYPVPILFQT